MSRRLVKVVVGYSSRFHLAFVVPSTIRASPFLCQFPFWFGHRQFCILSVSKSHLVICWTRAWLVSIQLRQWACTRISWSRGSVTKGGCRLGAWYWLTLGRLASVWAVPCADWSSLTLAIRYICPLFCCILRRVISSCFSKRAICVRQWPTKRMNEICRIYLFFVDPLLNFVRRLYCHLP